MYILAVSVMLLSLKHISIDGSLSSRFVLVCVYVWHVVELHFFFIRHKLHGLLSIVIYDVIKSINTNMYL